MTRQEIENKIRPIFPDVLRIDIEKIDNSCPLWRYREIDDLDIVELLFAIDDVFGTNLVQNRDIDLYKLTIEDLYNLIEREVNK